MKVSFSLAKKPETAPQLQLKKPPAPAQKPSLFNADDDDEDALVPNSKPDKKNGIGIQTVSAETSKARKKRELAEMSVDSTVYQYDEVWDRMQAAKQRVKEAKIAESAERKVRLPAPSLCIQRIYRLDVVP
jgi:coiled-coil domain-containing protein 55